MPKVSAKKRKFIERNYKRLSPAELAHHTGLTPDEVTSLIVHYTKDKFTSPTKDGSTLSWKTFFFILLFFAVSATIIYFPSLHGQFVFDDEVIENERMLHITRLSQLFDLLTSWQVGRRIGMMSFALNYYFGGGYIPLATTW
jgi:hypothetical protein